MLDTYFLESILIIKFISMPEFIFNSKLYYNPVEFVMDRIGGTWKMPILWRLRDKTLRYNELKKTMPKVTHKMLTASLRELEEDGFISRMVYPVVPPKVEYSLTDRGKESIPVISDLRQYGFRLMKDYGIDVGQEDVQK
jgi:DNA-binding HxlR family transcriptional regulator